jgi:predicted TIM-barrel fold metal-dependent hydrolase
MTALFRVDIHHHPSPPSYLAARVARDREYHWQRDWTEARTLEDMDRGDVQTAMLSLPHSVQIWPSGRNETNALARDWNEFMAKMASDHPGRFGVFAVLPILDIDASLREIEYAFDTLKVDGVGLMTNIGDRWLGDTHYAPVFEELNRRGAIVYTHPVAPTCCRDLIPELNDSLVEYNTDTTRAIAKVLFTGSAGRYPRLRFIFSHGGGTFPYLVGRFLRAYDTAKDDIKASMPGGLLAALNRFYFDTANSAQPYTMATLTKVVQFSQILFGTDFPYSTAVNIARGLATCGFTEEQLRAIDYENAHRLLPRLKTARAAAE